jgi:hypothetical protein
LLYQSGTLIEGAASQVTLPILGIVAATVLTFYTVSFMELRDVYFLLFPFSQAYLIRFPSLLL